MSSLPRFVVFKSLPNQKYLRYIHEEDGEITKGLLQFSGEEVVSPDAKYEVEKAKSGKPGLVHIRCCYNNKYWVRNSYNSFSIAAGADEPEEVKATWSYWIVAGADEPDEDQSKRSCTLFEPLYADDRGDNMFRFIHVQSGRWAYLWRTGPPTTDCVFLPPDPQEGGLYNVFEVTNWESLLILPKHITFKGDNGKYLSAINNVDCIPRFTSTDSGEPAVGYEIFPTGDGSVRIKSDYIGKFWIADRDYIRAFSVDTSNKNPLTLFWPIKVDNNVIALHSLGNNNICQRFTDKSFPVTDGLFPNVTTISNQAHMEVEELVISREISNVNFRLTDARIYEQNITTLATAHGSSISSASYTMPIKLSHPAITTSTWDTSLSLKLGFKFTFESGIPYITDQNKVEISGDQFAGTYQWGETNTSTTVMEPTLPTIVVPPMTSVKVNLVATKGSCDVPFSYTQRDVLTNGQDHTYNKDDGIYTGSNYYNYRIEPKPEELCDV